MRSKLLSKMDSFWKSSLANLTLDWKMNSIVVFFLEKRHYPIVAFYINATIGTKTNATIVFVFQPKVEFAKLNFQKESNLQNNFKCMPHA